MQHPTTLELERRAQQAWVTRDASLTDPVVNRLLEREFLPPGQVLDLEARELGFVLNFARKEVPYYRKQEQWQKLPTGKSALGREYLLELPVLSKFDVQENFDSLRAERTPPGHEPFKVVSSSGTTGKPTSVMFCVPALAIFGFYLQRQMRWFRVDPSWKKAFIRLPHNIPSPETGKPLALGEVFRDEHWANVGDLFKTGPTVGFSRLNPTEEKLKFLRREEPQYLMSFPGTLESLVLASQGLPVHTLKAARTISATLTPGMRQRIESASGLHVQQNYGLNEIGIVALRCPQGRYHVNSEHCLVEILDADNQPCAPGETGRIVVTALTNPPMPLVRYDSGDLGVAVGGECPCGRTSPGFGEVLGRYRPMHLAPPGTADKLQVITDAIDDLPVNALESLREYQVHQYRDGSFELRLVLAGEGDPSLEKAVRRAWDEQYGPQDKLEIRRVDAIPRTPSGKQQEFSSDFFPDPTGDVST